MNKNAKRKVRVPDIIEQAARKLDQSDILKIQESVYTADDKVDIAWQQYNNMNSANPVTREQFLNIMLAGYSHQGRRRANDRQLNLRENEGVKHE